jgi:4-amino-4-deoxy-L-arabinose transferase-like glycosyltransferase
VQKPIIPFLLLLLLAVGFRILQIQADPPDDFSWSGGYFADEGFWSHNARNAVLFGNPVQDEWDARIISPIFARLQQCIFWVFGAGLLQVRLIGILSSLILAAASFGIFRLHFDVQKSFFFSILVSLNYPMMVFGRQGILDPFAAALAWCALLFLLRNSFATVFFAGVFFVLSCITKYLMIYVAVPFAFIVWTNKRYVPFLIGALFTFFVWFALNYIPHKDLLTSYGSYYASQQSWQIGAVLKNLALQPFYLYFVKSPAILCMANLAIWIFVFKRTEWSLVEKSLLIWLITGILFFAIWKYRPFRYYTSLIPPLAAISGIALMRIGSFHNVKQHFIIAFGVFLPAVQMIFVLMDRFAGWNFVPEQLGIQTFDAILLIAFTAVIIFTLTSGRHLSWIGIGFVFVFLLSDVRNYTSWMIQPEYAAMNISHDLQSRVKNGVITGQWAPELCLENKLRVVPVWRGFVNSQNPFQKFGITHILQWDYPLGGEKFDEWYPEEFKQFRLITKYRIKDSDLSFYEREEK